MTTTRKTYEAVAAALKARLDSGSYCWPIRDVAWDLAAIFAEDNPRFDKPRFLAACGLEDDLLIVGTEL